ncbi:MAG: hypothetical protein QOE61_2273 [Micromonosporaceae bacterium]|jgi:hypothetical protein|nr:hypothetical protein [Micromonosporaceae bacterium]
MRELIAPTTRLHTAWLEAHAEWGPGLHEDGFGLVPSDEVDSPAGFATWNISTASRATSIIWSCRCADVRWRFGQTMRAQLQLAVLLSVEGVAEPLLGRRVRDIRREGAQP